jgi:alkylation response protein AidB-like acyl-CoA dehydrogenase
MQFDFTDEQKALKRTARQFLSVHSTSEKVREAMVSPLGYDPEVWRLICTEMGWPALIIPEEYGGAGGTYVDLAAVMEECGYFLLCAPLLSTVMATNALLIAGSEEQKREYLPKIAAGELTATTAFGAEFKPNEIVGVIDGASADVLFLRGAGIVRPPKSDRVALTTVDQTRHRATIMIADAMNGPIAAENFAIALLAAEQVGGAQRCLDMSVDYAKTRNQFGRAIGSFQAIKHKCAEMMMQVESARSAAYAAVAAISGYADRAAEMVPVAKVYCSDTFFNCASEAIQIHGGIGFTWEGDVHLYFKRARSSAAFIGSADDSRQHLAHWLRQ